MIARRHPLIATVVLLFCLCALALGAPCLPPLDARPWSSRLSPNPTPPASPVKLIFIHHSTGENWLGDGNGGLGIALRDAGYFVSDTNYGWGPADQDAGSETIGDHTEIGHWYNWFAGPHRDTYLAALYAESGQHSGYSRLGSDPGGQNEIVMFKSCFPNSNLGGQPNDPPTTGTNPLRGEGSGSAYHTVGNAKGIYNDLLPYFSAHQDKLFIVVTAPPLADFQTGPEAAANARALNDWLLNDWLVAYPHHNVFVFDFYNVLTSNGGDADTNDLGQQDGNHHRWWNGQVQHLQTLNQNTSAYPTGDSHPSAAGGQKASAEFVPLLNVAYHLWKEGGQAVTATPTRTAGASRTATATRTAGASRTATRAVTPTSSPTPGEALPRLVLPLILKGIAPDSPTATPSLTLTETGVPPAEPTLTPTATRASGSARTYYVRPDGGTAAQCTGRANAPYPGSGTAQPCAWAHPFWALDDAGHWRIAGGDTLLIASGTYMMGLGAPHSEPWCSAESPWDCHLPPLPSGPDATHPTRLLGAGWDGSQAQRPQLWGTERANYIVDLEGTSNAVVAGLELTDHAACAEGHPEVPCQRDVSPYGLWAAVGLYAADSRNVDLSRLDIHGLASRGVLAGRLTDWRVTDVRIALNGGAGWDGDLADEALGTSNHGTLSFTRFVLEWNGCVESADGQPANCWAQNMGGYGDGLGTGDTAGTWVFRDSTIRYNTSDGLDLLYARPASGSDELPFIAIERSVFIGNAGNQVKTNGSMRMENSLVVGNCGFFLGKPYAQAMGPSDSGDHCRAYGSAVSLSLGPRNAVTVTNSTVVGEGDCLVIVGCDPRQRCNGSEKVILANSVFSGTTDFTDPTDQTCLAWLDTESSPPYTGTALGEYNLYNNLKYDASFDLGSHALQDRNPLFVNSAFESFDGRLRSGSPAVDSGLPVGLAPLGETIPARDLAGTSRPQGAGVDRGAYER